MKYKVITALLIFTLLPASLMGASMTVGAASWVAWWDPAWSAPSTGIFSISSVRKSFSIKPGVLYGPTISFNLPKRVSITSMFFMSRFEADIYTIMLSPSVLPMDEKRTIYRFDSDTTIGYSFTKFFRLFLGFKFQRYKYKEINNLGIIYMRIDKINNGYAPALGIAFTVTLQKSVYLFFTASALYEFSHYFEDAVSYSIYAPPFDQPAKKISIGRMGLNSGLSLAYLIERINTILTLGFRYQMFKPVSYSEYKKAWSYYDHFYGITASASYRIDFPGKQKK